MKIASLDDNANTFYNITIEDKNGVEGMFITQYKTNSSNENQGFGSASTKRIDDLQETVGAEDFGNEEGGDEEGSSGATGSTTYPTDCDGTVISTTIAVDVPCGCGHSVLEWELGICTGSSCGDPFLPYYDFVTTYECVFDSGGDNPPDGGDPNAGGST
ncbi:hypothetical protein, partial [uncultured Winogradskyella sp.]|uniref:hypothetical protein n=1 Tax=uncultured Winogradskyella sp. TaxID=395353 RepID=UPI00261984D2